MLRKEGSPVTRKLCSLFIRTCSKDRGLILKEEVWSRAARLASKGVIVIRACFPWFVLILMGCLTLGRWSALHSGENLETFIQIRYWVRTASGTPVFWQAPLYGGTTETHWGRQVAQGHSSRRDWPTFVTGDTAKTTIGREENWESHTSWVLVHQHASDTY